MIIDCYQLFCIQTVPGNLCDTVSDSAGHGLYQGMHDLCTFKMTAHCLSGAELLCSCSAGHARVPAVEHSIKGTRCRHVRNNRIIAVLIEQLF